MLGISTLDWLVILAYLVGILINGLWAMRRVHSAADYFISDRNFGKLMMAAFSFATATSSDQAVAVAAKAYRVGASGIWYQWLYLFATPFLWLIGPLFRRMRAVTTADYFETRYDRSVGVLYAATAVVQLALGAGVMLKGSAAVITAVSGGAIAPQAAVGMMTVLFVVYGLAGGLNAAILTDLVQGLLTLVLSFLVLPFALSAVGGLAGLRAAVGEDFFFQMVTPPGGEITWFAVAMLSINALVSVSTQPETMGKGGAGRTEMDSRVGFVAGSFAKRICTIAWVLTGMCAVAYYRGREVHVDLIYGMMARDLLAGAAPGLVGLFVASMLAAVMSSCDAKMVLAAGLFTNHLYRPFVAPGRDDRHYMSAGRVCSAAVVLASVVFAMAFESVLQGLEVFWMFSAIMGVPFWVGLFWRRATTAGALAGTLAGFGAWALTGRLAIGACTLWDFGATFGERLPACMLWTDGHRLALALPWQMLAYLVAGLVACVSVSLFTRPVDAARLDRFFACLRTPVSSREPASAPFTLPEGVAPAPRDVLLSHPNFEIPRPSKTSVVGFLAAWGGVILLIGVFYAILGF